MERIFGGKNKNSFIGMYHIWYKEGHKRFVTEGHIKVVYHFSLKEKSVDALTPKSNITKSFHNNLDLKLFKAVLALLYLNSWGFDVHVYMSG